MDTGHPSSRLSPRGAMGVLVAAWGVLGAACTTVSTTPAQSALTHALNGSVSVLSLRAMQNQLAVQVPGTIEVAADAIAAQSTDPRLRRRALMWKIEMVPAFYEAIFNADPLAGALDTLALSVQVEAYFETGGGKEDLAPLQSLAIQSLKQVHDEVVTAGKAVARTPEGFAKAQALVETWARANPIREPLSSRPSILGHLAEIAASGGQDISVFQVVGDLPATVDDLATRLDIYTAYLPRAGRWQAELLVDDLNDRAEAQRVLATFASVRQIADRINQLVSPEALQHALDMATADLRKERVAGVAAVDALRMQTQAYVTGEREATLAAVAEERRTILADVDRQRLALLQEVDALRKQTALDADALASRIIWRSAFAAAGLLVLAAGLTTLVLWRTLRHRA